ncbi:MAG: hypothetical protein IT563_14115 [Alphaproteobacteria bacterium]|nr:hypothetical protein [Alphaproteobacteria bacterium]
MATHSTTPYANPAAVQTAVLQPPAAQNNQQTAAAKRSFKSFVEAMDDFSGDRRDVAGMRQMLAMQEANAVAAARSAVPVASSFAPQQAQPEVPVVRGPAQDAPPRPNPANVIPGLPGLPGNGPVAVPPPQVSQSALPQAEQVSALPSLPAAPAESAASAAAPPMLVIDPAKIHPATARFEAPASAERIVAYMPIQPNPAAASPAKPVSADQNLPQPLRSPLVDEMRQATRAGTRPGLTDETMARFAASAERKRMLSAPMPPRLMAQEARWNRDAWPATVRASNATPPTTTASADAAGVLPRLPAAPALQ